MSAHLVAPGLALEELVELLGDGGVGDILGLLDAEHSGDLLFGLVECHAGDVCEGDVPHHGLLIQGGVEARDEHEATIASLGDDSGEQRADLHVVSFRGLCVAVSIL